MKLSSALVVLGLGLVLVACGRIGYEPELFAMPDGSADGGARGASPDSGGGDSSTDATIDGSPNADAADDSMGPDAPLDDAADADAGPTCRAGCSCEWYFGHRYMLCPDKIPYTAARDSCRSYGMRLARLTGGQEHSFLRLRSQQDAYPKFHIGASDALQEGVWLWDDGTQFWSGAAAGTAVGGRYAFWASGEPNNQGGNENCAEVQSIQGWNDSVCDFEAKPFICKQYRDPLPAAATR
jgi:hypothetical protein